MEKSNKKKKESKKPDDIKTKPDKTGEAAYTYDFVDSLVFTEDIEKLLSQINSTYNDLQERQKKLISEIITSKLYSSRYITPKLRDFTFRIIRKNGLSFVSDEMYDYCVSSGNALTQKEIGARNGRTEASVSRTLRNFQISLNDLIQSSTTG